MMMKMPGHRFPLFSHTPRPDIFGLHYLSLLAEAALTTKERQERIARIEAGVTAAFQAAARHLGQDQARQLFQRVTRRPKRGLGRAFVEDRDMQLLKAYDEAVKKGETVAALARRLRTTNGTKLGNTPKAIEAQIRKLVGERKKNQRAIAVQHRYWRMATRNDPPTLLGGSRREKK